MNTRASNLLSQEASSGANDDDADDEMFDRVAFQETWADGAESQQALVHLIFEWLQTNLNLPVRAAKFIFVR